MPISGLALEMRTEGFWYFPMTAGNKYARVT